MTETTTPTTAPDDGAARRLLAYLDALDHERATLGGRKHFFIDGRIEERHGTDGNTHVLYRGDLRSLLADLAIARAGWVAMANQARIAGAERDQLRAELERLRHGAEAPSGRCEDCGCCTAPGCRTGTDSTCPTDRLGDSVCPCTGD